MAGRPTWRGNHTGKERWWVCMNTRSRHPHQEESALGIKALGMEQSNWEQAAAVHTSPVQARPRSSARHQPPPRLPPYLPLPETGIGAGRRSCDTWWAERWRRPATPRMPCPGACPHALMQVCLKHPGLRGMIIFMVFKPTGHGVLL